MKKYMQVKKNHHYVWAFYLKQWAIGQNMFYVTKSGKIACDSVRGLSCEHGFYKINPLSEIDIEFIKSWSKNSPQDIQDIHMKFLKNFVSISRATNAIRDAKLEIDEVNIIDKALKYNSMEDLHSIIEEGVMVVLQHLCSGDLDILLSNQNMVALCSYMGHQLTRTKIFKESSIAAVKNMAITSQHQELIYLIEKNWWFLSFMMGINIGCSLYNYRHKSNNIFIVNTTKIPFITSNNPVINIHSSLSELNIGDVPKFLDLYFPLSPKYAYMINESVDYNELSDTIKESDVQRLNQLIVNKSDKTIYGNSEEILKSIMNTRRT